MQERDERQKVESGPSQSSLRPLGTEEGPLDWDSDRKASK